MCNYQTKRGHDLVRHRNAKHVSSVMVLSLLDDIVTNVTKEMEDISNDFTSSEATTSGIRGAKAVYPAFSSFEQEHYDRLAAYKAEFRALYPTFDDEVRALRVSNKRPTVKKAKGLPIVQRKSARINRDAVTCHGDTTVEVPNPTHENTEGELDETNDELEIPQQSTNEPYLEVDNDIDMSQRFSCLHCEKSFR